MAARLARVQNFRMPEYRTTSEAADFLRFKDESRVRQLCLAGAFPNAVKRGGRGAWLIPQSDLDAWLESNAEQPAGGAA